MVQDVEIAPSLSQNSPIKKPIPLKGRACGSRGTTLLLALRPSPALRGRIAAWPLEDFISVSTAAPYCCFRRAAPGRVQGPAATGFTPITGSLGQGILTTPVPSGIRNVLT